METIRILMTGAGAPGCPSILNCLRNNGERDLYIVGVDMNPMATCRSRVDAFYQVPRAEDPNFLESILDICKKEKIQILISIVTRELEIFAKEKSRFLAIGTLISTMDYGPLHIANNKGLLLQAMKEGGIPTPDFYIANTPIELEEGILKLGYPQKPVVVKPTFGNGSRGVRILNANRSRYEAFFNSKPNNQEMVLEELMDIISERNTIPEMIVMEYLPGDEICVDALADHGETLYVSCRHGVVVSSIMVSSIVSKNEEAIELAKKTIKLLSLDGNIDFDMKNDDKGHPQVMEINPRLPAGVAVQTMAGINFPYLRIKQLLGESLPNVKVTEGYTMQFRNEEVIYDPSGNLAPWPIK